MRDNDRMRQTSRWIAAVVAGLALPLAGCAASDEPAPSGQPGAATSAGATGTANPGPTPTPGPTSPTGDRTPPTTAKPAGTVTITRTGGIAGASELIKIATDGTWVYTDRKNGGSQQGKLTPT
ncbi:MAG: hypothetical protein ACREN5_13375, partial [Gemmatimonadales bacterium]